MNARESFGILTDYATGKPIRPATEAEWRKTAGLVNDGTSAGATGAWEDENGRAVWVDGGPDCETTLAESPDNHAEEEQ